VKISAALIMKNEEENLPRLLKSIQGKFDEVIVVDTGSTDRSKEIAKEFGCSVYEKEWQGFADARNYAISKCSGDWIWHFDADFELEDKEFEKFLDSLRLINKDPSVDSITIFVKNFSNFGMISGISSQAFIHKNRADIYWQGNIHEQLNAKRSILLPVYINHYGYQDREIQIQKAFRNKELIQKDLAAAKDKDPKEYLVKLFYMLQTLSILADVDKKFFKESQYYIQEFLKVKEEFSKNGELRFFIYYPFFYIARLLMKQNKKKEALEYLNLAIKENFLNADLFYCKTLIEKDLDKEAAKSSFVQACILNDKMNKIQDTQVVDNVENIYAFIEHEALELYDKADIEWLQKEWKKERSSTLGILVCELVKKYDFAKYEKCIKKLLLRFPNNQWVQAFALKSYFTTRFAQALPLAKKIVQTNADHLLANKVLGEYYFRQKEYLQAVQYLKKVVLNIPDRAAADMLIQALEHLGFEKEVQKFVKKLKKD